MTCCCARQYATTVQTNAALALCRLCTLGPGRAGAAIVSHPPDQAPEASSGSGASAGRQLAMDRIAPGMALDAVRRLQLAAATAAPDEAAVAAVRWAIRAAIDGLDWPWPMQADAADLYEAM